MVKVVKAFKGVRDGEVIPVDFEIGDDVEGKLADVALAEGWAEAEPPAPPPKSPDDKKALKGAPENK